MPQVEAIPLQYKMFANEEYIYEITVKSERTLEAAGKLEQERNLLLTTMTQRVLDVGADDVYTIEMLVEPRKLTKNGQDVPISSPPQKINMKMTKYGKILESSLQSPATQPSFPTRPVFVGETWEGESQVSLQDPSTGRPIPPVTLKFQYHLKSVEKIKGCNCAHIEVTNPETEVPLSQGVTQKIAASGKTLFAYAEGRLMQSNVDTQISMNLPEGSISTTVNISVVLADTPLSKDKEEFFIPRA